MVKRSLYPQIEQFWFQIFASTFIPEAVARRGSVEKVWPATLLKGDSGAGVFLWILRNNNDFYRTPPLAASFIQKSL